MFVKNIARRINRAYCDESYTYISVAFHCSAIGEKRKARSKVLKKHQLTAFPQMKLNFLSMASKKNVLAPNDELDKLSNWMQEHSFRYSERWLSTICLVTFRRLVLNFMKAGTSNQSLLQRKDVFPIHFFTTKVIICMK